MDHRFYTEEIKAATKKQRRLEAKVAVHQNVSELEQNSMATRNAFEAD